MASLRPTSVGGQWHLVWVFLVPIRPTTQAGRLVQASAPESTATAASSKGVGTTSSHAIRATQWPHCHRLVKIPTTEVAVACRSARNDSTGVAASEVLAVGCVIKPTAGGRGVKFELGAKGLGSTSIKLPSEHRSWVPISRHTGGGRDWEWAQAAGMISKPEATDVTVEHLLVDVVHHHLVANDVDVTLGLIHEFWSWIARDGAYRRLG